MEILINHTSLQPIYEQIQIQIKGLILKGVLKSGELLPSVRQMSRDLKISVLTVKKAYDLLEEEGLIVTVHGKGSFIKKGLETQLLEEVSKQVERKFSEIIDFGKKGGLSNQEIKMIFDLLMEE